MAHLCIVYLWSSITFPGTSLPHPSVNLGKVKKCYATETRRNLLDLVCSWSYCPYMYTLSIVFIHIPWNLSSQTTFLNLGKVKNCYAAEARRN